MKSASELERTTSYLLIPREAVSSSRMEGTWSTVDEVLSPAAADSGRTASVSVRGYANALLHAFQAVEKEGLAALSPRLLCTLHERFMEKDPHFRGVAGRLRAPGLPGDVVQIGSFGRKEDAIYNPAPPVHVRRCLDEVLDWMRDETLVDRRISEFVCRAIVTCHAEESETQRVLQTLATVWHARGPFRRNSAAERALDVLVRMPIITVKTLAAELAVSGQAANEAVRRLQESAVISERSGRSRGRLFAAEEVIGVLARPFGSDPDVALEGARRTLGLGD